MRLLFPPRFEARRHRSFRCPSAILHLLAFGRPSTVTGFVVPVVVNAVKGMAGARFKPHVFQESFEVVKPSWAHPDASPAVIRPRLISWACATSNHVRPCAIFRTRRRNESVPMSEASRKNLQRVSMLEPSVVMLGAPPTRLSRPAAPLYGALAGGISLHVVGLALPANSDLLGAALGRALVGGVRMIEHWKASFSGVMGQAVPAALPFYFTSLRGPS